jgi:hypothetical protein
MLREIFDSGAEPQLTKIRGRKALFLGGLHKREGTPVILLLRILLLFDQ